MLAARKPWLDCGIVLADMRMDACRGGCPGCGLNVCRYDLEPMWSLRG